MKTLQKTLITAIIVVALSAAIYEVRNASTLRSQVESLQQQQAPLTDQNAQLTRDRNDATRQLHALRQENERLNRNTSELLRLRGEVGLLRKQTNELAALRAAEASARNSQRVAPPLEILQPQPVQPLELVGIGVALQLDASTQMIRIMNTLSNTPAAEAGLSAGFVVLKIDGVPTAGKSLVDCVNLIRGTVGTKVRLEVLAPDGNKTDTVELTRRKIQ